MNEAFECLRQHTSTSSNHRLPKVQELRLTNIHISVIVFQVEILRNAISYIQSLEKCLGISFQDERKENVVSSKDSEEDNDYETFKCLEASDESVTSISVPLQDRTSRTSSKHKNLTITRRNEFIFIAEPCHSSLEYLNTIVDNINSGNAQYAPSTSSKKSVLPQ